MLPNRKISASSESITKWPAAMLAKSRSISANGFTIFPMISMGVMISVSSTAVIPVVPGGVKTMVLM